MVSEPTEYGPWVDQMLDGTSASKMQSNVALPRLLCRRTSPGCAHRDGIEVWSRKLRHCRIELDASHADAAACLLCGGRPTDPVAHPTSSTRSHQNWGTSFTTSGLGPTMR